MLLYSGPSLRFFEDATHNRVADKLKAAYFNRYRRDAGPSEVESWRNSLRAMAMLLSSGGFDDHGILLEYELPLSSLRLDCMVTGKNASGRDNAVIVELKQWGECREGNGDKVVTWVAGDHREVLHPSVQVGQYNTYLRDTQPVFYEGRDPIELSACAYLHNYPLTSTDVLLAPKFTDVVSRHPIFDQDGGLALTDFVRQRVGEGNGMGALRRITESKYRPSKKLLEHVGKIVDGKSEYVLLDEQLVTFNRVLAEADEGFRDRRKSVILVRGGPGTGKSVIALNLLAELSRQDLNAQYVTGSRAFTETLREIVGRRASQQLRYFNSYMTAGFNDIDVMVCDEAHRIRETSNSQWTKREDRSDKPQIDELFHAAKVLVFFVDDDQVVRPNEIGSSEVILEAAARHEARIFDYTLKAQFRCNGSDGFINWVNNTLDINRTANVIWNLNDAFEFKIVDSPFELEQEINARLRDGYSARMTAGFCWPWSEPRPDGTLELDLQIGDFRRPWNAKSSSRRKLAANIPPESLWAFKDGGEKQVGCIYTAQGFEFDYVGVIFGKDLVYRHGPGWQANKEESADGFVKRSNDKFEDLVKNVYRVLFTRGLKGCYVYFMDKETEDFFRSRTERLADQGQDAELPMAAEERAKYSP